jgi:hypothetical protein
MYPIRHVALQDVCSAFHLLKGRRGHSTVDRDSGDRKIVPEGFTSNTQESRGWLGCPRTTDDVQRLGNPAAADDVCLRSIISHAAVLRSINPMGKS